MREPPSLHSVIFRTCAGVLTTLVVAEVGAIAAIDLGHIWLSATLAGIIVAAAAP